MCDVAMALAGVGAAGPRAIILPEWGAWPHERKDSTMDIDIEEVISWVREGGALARSSFNHVAAHHKPDRTLVTAADVAVERVLRARIQERYPRHGIMGEELGQDHSQQELLWALDPIDGTKSFIAGLPTWGISLGLLRNGVPYFGIIYLSLMDDCYWAGPSGEAFLNGRAIQVAAPRGWESEDWIAVPSNSHRRFTIDFAGKTRSLGCTAASFCYVARGGALGALITRAAIWDIAAGLAILEAAGGVAIGLAGAPLDAAILLDGRLLPEPAIIGAESHCNALRAVIHERAAPAA